MFNKHFILLLINVGLCLSELTIAPTDQIVINEGNPLEITCTASEDVDFFYPKFISFSVDTSPSSITNEPANGGSKFIFKRPKAVYGDTGYYGCVEASKNKRKLNLRNVYVTPETYDEIDIKWTYVYVKSGESKSPDSAVDAYSLGTVNQEMNITKGDTMTMHCSASTGRVAIKETKAAQSHSSQLTITDVLKSDEGEYTCEETTNGLTVKNYYHVQVNASAVISVSVILQLSIILLSYFM